MSRGVKDLRELICVSRLTIRDSDDECPSSSDEQQCDMDRSASRVSTTSSSVTPVNDGDTSPDSGIITSMAVRSPDTQRRRLRPLVDTPQSLCYPAAARKRRRRRKKKVSAAEVSSDSDLFNVFDLSTKNHITPFPDDVAGRLGAASHERLSPIQGCATDGGDGNFDSLLMYMDPVVVSEWLVQANKQIADLSSWAHQADNFVRFTHFWLTNFSDSQRADIFRLEHSIIVDSLLVAFAAGRNAGHVNRQNLLQYLVAVLREYPARMLSSKGTHLFLDYLDVLTSGREAAYRHLLTDVRCSTRVGQYAQWTLALRSFALVSMWYAVIDFYRRLCPDSKTTLPTTHSMGNSNTYAERTYQAIRHGFVDVVHYMIVSGKVSPFLEDSHKKTLVFIAVMHEQLNLLKYLFTQMSPCPNINQPADTGNTPLHAAANSGNAELVKLLLKQPNIDLNPPNAQCENATPLHLAVLHGHTTVVKLLLKAGADRTAKMGELSIYDIARDFDHTDILTVFTNDKT